MGHVLRLLGLLWGASMLGGCIFDARGLLPQSDGSVQLQDHGGLRPDQRSDTGQGEDAKPLAGLKELNSGEGRLWIGLSTASPPIRLLSWRASATPSYWFKETRLPALHGNVQWVINQLLPSHRELAMVKILDGAIELLQRLEWDGANWSEDLLVTTIPAAHGKMRDFAMARESSSGDVLLVYRDDQRLQFQTMINGQWSLAQPVAMAFNNAPEDFQGDPLWVELISRPGQDEIALIFADTDGYLTIMIWDGQAFSADRNEVLEEDLKKNPESDQVMNRPFDAAYLSQSGDLLVAWANNTDDGFYYRRRQAAGNWEKKEFKRDVPRGKPEFIDLASDPSSNRVAAAFLDLGNDNERLALGIWEENSWVEASEYEAIRDVNDTATGDFPGAVAWLGTQGKAICIFADDSKNMLNWYSWEKANKGGKWVRGSSIPVPGMGEVESVSLSRIGQGDTLMAIFSDDQSVLYYAQYDGVAWKREEVLLTEELAQLDTMPFSFAVMP